MARQRIESQGAFEDRRFGLLPLAFARRVGARFVRKKAADPVAANLWLLDETAQFDDLVIPLYCTDADIVAIANRKAADMMDRAGRFPADLATIRERLAGIVRRLRMVPPGEKKGAPKMTDRAAVARMTCPQWWRRQLRAVHARQIEATAIGYGFVHAGKGGRPYCSDVSLRRRQEQKRRNAAGLENTLAVNEDGEAFTLAELAARSVANPTIRRGELMTRIRGFEEIAVGLGHAAEFATVTCSSRMHARLHDGGAENPAYDGTTPKQASAYLGRLWGRIRAALARLGIALYGFRIAEPHHDATPHWHMLYFFDPAGGARDKIITTFRRYALADSPDEKGAQQYRCKFVEIDAAKGTAAGYIAKYVAKNIDGYGVETDLLGNPAIVAAQRVETWASTWGIRQFQQFGGPPVGVWRELRRIESNTPSEGEAGMPAGPAGVGLPAIEQARIAADAGNWRRYVEVMGGPLCPRKLQPLAVAREDKEREGRYFEIGKQVVGVLDRLAGCVVASVRRVWQIIVKGSSGMPKGGRQGAGFPWTRVNNCTEGGSNGSGNGSGRADGIAAGDDEAGICGGGAACGGAGGGAGRAAGGGRGRHDAGRHDPPATCAPG